MIDDIAFVIFLVIFLLSCISLARTFSESDTED